MHACKHNHTHACTHARTHTHACVHARMHASAHTHTHTHARTHTLKTTTGLFSPWKEECRKRRWWTSYSCFASERKLAECMPLLLRSSGKQTYLFESFFCLSPFHLHAFLLLFVYSSRLFASMVCKNAFVPLVPVEDNELFDFRGFRLDWFRLQVCLMMIMVKCMVMMIMGKCVMMMIRVKTMTTLVWSTPVD